MHARGAREELAILLPNTMSHYLRDGRHVLPERGVARPGLFTRLSEILGWVVELPMRERVIDPVAALSEQELADLELIRSRRRGWFVAVPECLTWVAPT